MDERAGHYTVLARRFRPQTFADVVGQQHVAQALKNAIAQGRVAHAYLFSGARGVGKTSMARILAKALNCPNVQDGVPCNACEICEGISAGHDVDVLEIDGASNRGIDDVRSLRANVAVTSMRTKYKVYIIDEVHMLTKEAFNALLKTLEEPPPAVKFIFCTTEPTKVPETILSRCQRFDFSLIGTAAIVDRLRQIAEAEQVDVDVPALELIARRAAGSMRDSQSLFDQLLAFGEERLTAADVHRLLGTAGDDRLIELADALIARRRDAVLKHLDRALSDGVQLDELVEQLVNYLRDLMVLAAGAHEVELLSVNSDERPTLAKQADEWGLQTILAAVQILAEAKQRMFRAGHARALAEAALVRISLLDQLEPLDRLISELKAGDGSAPRSGQPRPQPPAGKSVVPRSASVGQSDGSREEPVPPKPEKKTKDGEREAHLSVAEPPVGGSLVPFEPDRAEELWTQVLSQIHDMLNNHVRVVSSVAISGPNQLELTFPKSYHFSRRFCEQPDVMDRLQRLVGQVTGQPVRISLRLESEEPQEPSGASPAADTADPRRGEGASDPFVEQAKAVFEATVVKVDGRSVSSSADG